MIRIFDNLKLIVIAVALFFVVGIVFSVMFKIGLLVLIFLGIIYFIKQIIE